ESERRLAAPRFLPGHVCVRTTRPGYRYGTPASSRTIRCLNKGYVSLPALNAVTVMGARQVPDTCRFPSAAACDDAYSELRKTNPMPQAGSVQITHQPIDAEDAEATLLLNRAAGGDIEAWGALLARHQERLLGVVSFRLDPRLRGRIDGADVLQETFIAATARREEFFRQSTQPLFLWLRWMVGNTLLELHRHHLGAQMRETRREAC